MWPDSSALTQPTFETLVSPAAFFCGLDPLLRAHPARHEKQIKSDLIVASISGKYDFPTKITADVSIPVTSQSNCEVIFVADRIGDPQNRVFQRYSPL